MATTLTVTKLDIRPLAGALGAEVCGVDLTAADSAAWEAIRAAFLEHMVLTFPGQKLDPKALVRVGSQFGTVGFYPFVAGLAEEPHIFPVVKEPDETRNFGENWHSDTTYSERPPKATVLYAIEVPPYGGDTVFANTAAAYDMLSDGMKATLAGLRGVNSSGKRAPVSPAEGNAAYQAMQQRRDNKLLEAVHPVVRTHPETGRKAIYVNPTHTLRLEGWRESESQGLLAYLFRHVTKPEFTCRVGWKAGTLVVWDNRCTQHIAVNDYHGHRREMHRLSIEGDAPF